MAAFQYKAFDGGGQVIEGVIEADNLRLARQQLRESGFTVLDAQAIAHDTPDRAQKIWRLRRGISAADLGLLTRQLATLLQAGLPLEQALSALIEQTEAEPVRRVLAGVRAEVLGGSSLAKSMERYGTVFPEIYLALVRAGESSGNLPEIMSRLADYTESRHALQQKVGLAFVYPAIVTVVALSVVTGLLIYVVPQVAGVFQHSKQTLPWLTRMMLFISAMLQEGWPYLLLGGAGAAFGARALLKQEEMRFRWHARLLHLPLVGRLLRGINTARMASTLAILVGSGVPLLTALREAARVVANLPMRRALEEAAQKVREGVTLSRALAASGLFPPILVHLIASGESSGKLDTMLDRAAAQQEREVANFVTLLTALLEPMLILAMGVVVLIIVLAILLPIIEMNQMVH
ncbi:MAG TPA: type II secretion system inner membrane protein GspF [Gallionellaceae bacterium]